MMEDQHMSHRLLRATGTGSKTDAGPLAVLISVCVLFCIIWIPMLFRRRCQGTCGNDQAEQIEAERQAELIRFSLENLHRLGLHEVLTNNRGAPAVPWNPIRSMSPDDRREYINNVLVSRKILKVSKEGPLTDDGDLAEDDSTSKPTGRKTSLLLADVVDVQSTTKVVSVEPCIICLNDYVEGDILCWSQNSSKCQHFMHKECALEWLMNHEECPLCRHNYLSLGEDDDDDDDEQLDGERDHADHNNRRRSNRRFATGEERDVGNNTESEAHSILRGINLIYALSQLQNLAHARPNTTFRLQGIELADGQRGTVEIQRTRASTERSSASNNNNTGLNIRVTPLGNGSMTNQPAVTDGREVSTIQIQEVVSSQPGSSSGGVIDGDLQDDAD